MVQPGQLSPDGHWRWDGATWVPAALGASPIPTPRRSRSWIWWLAGGCAILLVIGAVGVGFGVYSLVNRFQHGGFSCLPSDFPSYPGASAVNENAQVGNEFSPGDNSRCTMVFESNDGLEIVTAFYRSEVNATDWTITSPVSNGEFQFQRRSRPQTVGTVALVGSGQHTVIHIQLDS